MAAASRDVCRALLTWVEELSGQGAEAALEAGRWQRQFCCLQERYRALRDEKERLQEELDALHEANEELRRADGALVGSLAAELIPAGLRDMVMRLQRENRWLQERLEAAGVTPLHSTQGDSQAEFLLLDETIDDLAALQWDQDLDPHKDSSGPQSVMGLQQRQWGPSEGGHQVLDPPVAPELLSLQNQLQEKEALIRHLEGDWERSRAQREREERLLVTAWYNMGLVLQQQQEEGGSFVASPAPPPRPPPHPLMGGGPKH